MKGSVKVTFLGAVGTVTGSKYLLELDDLKIMIDCGLFQGLKGLRLLNWNELPIKASEVDYVLLTHGHMDHVGYLPKFVNSGFKGPVLATKPTLSVASIILRDSAKIQEEDAERANKEGFSKHEIAKPLYDMIDAEKAIKLFEYVEENEWYELKEDIKIRFNYVGHIIGATYIELEVNQKRFVFSGDVGRVDDFILFPPKQPNIADFLFIESTYGDRVHPKEGVKDKLIAIIKETINLNGNIIIPSFAVERAQTFMLLLFELREEGKIPFIPLILDSPMGEKVLDLFIEYHSWHKLTMDEAIRLKKSFQVVESYKETWDVINKQTSKVIISGSGMISGGRVLTYLMNYIYKQENTVLISGFQAEGTRGRALIEGAKELKIFGKYYPVHARIEQLHSLSGHADQEELLNWISELESQPKQIYIIHGEQQASEIFKTKLKEQKNIDSIVPILNETIECKLD